MPAPEPEVDESEQERLRQEGAARRLEENNGDDAGGAPAGPDDRAEPPVGVVGPILVSGDVPVIAFALLLVGLLMGALAALVRPRSGARGSRGPGSSTPVVVLAGTAALVVLAGLILMA